MSDTMTPPSILDLARAALADRDRGTPGPWFAQLGDFYKHSGNVLTGSEPPNWQADVIVISHLFTKDTAADYAIITAARTREPLLAAEVIRQTEVVNAFVNETVRIEARLADAERQAGASLALMMAQRDEWAKKCDEAEGERDELRKNFSETREWSDSRMETMCRALADAERERDEAQAACRSAQSDLLPTIDGLTSMLTQTGRELHAAEADAATLRAANAELASELVELRKRVMSVAQERVIQAAVEWRDAAPEEESVEGRAARITSGWHLRRAVDALAKEPGQ